MMRDRTKATIFCSFLLVWRRIIPLLLMELPISYALYSVFKRLNILGKTSFCGSDFIISALLFVGGYEVFTEHSSFVNGYGISKKLRAVSFSVVSAGYVLLIAIADTASRRIVSYIAAVENETEPIRSLSGISAISGIVGLRTARPVLPVEILLTFILLLFAWSAGALFRSLYERFGKKTVVIAVCLSLFMVLAAFLQIKGVNMSWLTALPVLLSGTAIGAFIMFLFLTALFMGGALYLPYLKARDDT